MQNVQLFKHSEFLFNHAIASRDDESAIANPLAAKWTDIEVSGQAASFNLLFH